MVGRSLEKAVINKEKYALTTKLLVDKEGKKVGKTTGNALFILNLKIFMLELCPSQMK